MIHRIEQRSSAWFDLRLGQLTSSREADIMPGKRGGYLAGRENLLWELLAERITGHVEPKFVTAAMQHGITYEPMARALYEASAGVMVDEIGYATHDKIKGFGASPDGLVGKEGCCEVKAPTTGHFLRILASDEIDERWVIQMAAQMACTGCRWCDFICFDPRVPEDLQLYIRRIDRNQAMIDNIEAEAVKFLSELDALELKIRAKGGI